MEIFPKSTGKCKIIKTMFGSFNLINTKETVANIKTKLTSRNFSRKFPLRNVQFSFAFGATGNFKYFVLKNFTSALEKY